MEMSAIGTRNGKPFQAPQSVSCLPASNVRNIGATCVRALVHGGLALGSVIPISMNLSTATGWFPIDQGRDGSVHQIKDLLVLAPSQPWLNQFLSFDADLKGH